MAKPRSTRKEATARDVSTVGAREAARTFGVLLSRAGFGKERIAITRHGKTIAALVSAKDLEALDGAA